LESFKASLSDVQLDALDKAALSVNVRDYNFPFENLVFEGGGTKGLALIGAVKCLEELGIRQQIRRFAGTSAGAITAAMVALGYPCEDLMEFWSGDVKSLFSDHSCGYLSFLPNLLRKFGWNPGNRILGWLGKMIAAKSQKNNPDMTFYDLYREMQVELCIVVTNLNQMSTEYCHPKTTPDMPIRTALRMSMSIPGVFTAPTFDNHGNLDVCVDGGVLCNYPIHCFDGWFLSMAKQDTFLLRMHPLRDLSKLISNRFEAHNTKTLGFLLFSADEDEVLRDQLEKRQGALVPSKPSRDTKLYRSKQDAKVSLAQTDTEYTKMCQAMEAFMKVLYKHNLEELEFIDKGELRRALDDTEEFTSEQAKLLFGEHVDVDTVFGWLDRNGDGKVSFLELFRFIEERGMRFQLRFQGFARREVTNFIQFLKALQGTMLTNMKYVHVKNEDLARTVGINTGHIGTLDYGMDDADRQFAVQRGYNATLTYLSYCVAANYPGVVSKHG
ncbi:hypothetical protein PoB_003530600, partial [Plakobranchus ocellatus]